MPFDDISFLVSETLNHAQMQAGGNRLTPPNAPGVFYHLQQAGGVFVVRMFVSSDLKEDYNHIINAPEDYPTLRLIDDEGEVSWERLKFFECDRVEFAKSLKMKLSNQRFPLYEENVINVSDPSYSWWMQDAGNELKIFFKLSQTSKMKSLQKIGPLYDSKIAIEKFSKLYGYFSMLFPIDNFSSGNGELLLCCLEEGHPHFEDFKALFLSGEPEHGFWEHLRELEFEANRSGAPYLKPLQEANYFLMELATIRKFWKVIQSQLC